MVFFIDSFTYFSLILDNCILYFIASNEADIKQKEKGGKAKYKGIQTIFNPCLMYFVKCSQSNFYSTVLEFNLIKGILNR